jgi:hypothetical protein
MTKNAFGLIGWLLVVLAVVAVGLWPVGKPLEYPDSVLGQIVDIASEQSTVRVALVAKTASPKTEQPTKLFSVPADKKDLRTLLKSLHRGDLVACQAEKDVLKDLHVDTPEVSAWVRLAAMGGAAVLVWLFAWIVLGKGGVAQLILGIDGLYSKSKFQLVVWFGVLMVAYLSTLWLRFCYSSNWLIGTVNIPANLLALSGFSALTFAGAKAITQTKQDRVDAAVAKGVPGAEDLKKRPAANRVSNLVYDLVHDDSVNVDLGDFQMVLITLVAALTYTVQVFMFLRALDLSATVTLPDADGTLLAAFGLGQGAYLLKKAASGSNPDPNPAGPAVAAGGGGGAGGGAGAPAAPIVAPIAPVVAAAPAPPAAAAVPAAAAPAAAPQAVQRTRIGVEA